MICKECGGPINGTYKKLCKNCYNKDWNKQNKEHVKEYNKEWNIKNPNYHKEYTEKNRERDREKQRISLQKWRERNRERDRQLQKKWADNHKEYYRILNTKNQRYREKNDIDFKLKMDLSHSFRDSIKKQRTIKFKKTLDILGCTIQECREHLESQFKKGMNWDNHGHKGWHIDHIIPLASFDMSKEEEQKKAFHYTNLQPLWWQDNLEKSNKLNWVKE